MPGIVVGVDGSGHSRKALERAANEAAVHHVPLTVLTVHQAVRDVYGAASHYPEDAALTDRFEVSISANYGKSELRSTLTSTDAAGNVQVVSGIQSGNRLPTVEDSHGAVTPWVVDLPNHIENGDIVVPPGKYFMMGDHRHASLDSRFWGSVERKQIVGRATAVVLSFDKKNYWLPRWRRSFSSLRPN